MPIKVKKMRAHQPVFGENMPGSAMSKRVFGNIDRSPEELRRQSAKMMMGNPQKAASDDDKGVVPNIGKSQVGKSLRGSFEPDASPRVNRVNQGVDALSGTGFAGIEEAATKPAPATYKDWQKIGETPSHMIVAVSKKKVKV